MQHCDAYTVLCMTKENKENRKKKNSCSLQIHLIDIVKYFFQTNKLKEYEIEANNCISYKQLTHDVEHIFLSSNRVTFLCKYFIPYIGEGRRN